MRSFFTNNYINLSKAIIIIFVYAILYQSIIATAEITNTVKDMLIPLPLYQVLFSHKALAQQSLTTLNSSKDGEKIQKNSNIFLEASGDFANNQIKYGIVTWIQGGLWDLKIIGFHNSISKSSDSNNLSNKHNLTAVFNANFTMVKPNGSFSHSHIINNFVSNNIIFVGNDIIVTGIADIHSDIGMEFKHVPITIHLFNKKVIGLTIDEIKSNEHFASPNAIFGTIISGIGLDNNNTNESNITKSILK